MTAASRPPARHAVVHAASSAARVVRRLACRLSCAAALSLALSLIAGATPSTAAAPASSPASNQVSNRPVLLILGDSISAEYGLARDTGWVKLLEGRLRDEHYDYTVVNASISGETTSGGLSRIDELLGRVKPSTVVVELGGNDALRGLPIAATQLNLDAIVARSQNAKASVLIVGMQIPPNYGRVFADRFAAVFTSTSKRYGTALTPFFFAGFADRFELFQPDRIHPTADAQVRLLDNLWPDLKPLLRRARSAGG